MARNILSILVGIISSFIAILAIGSIAHIVNPPPVDPHDTEVFKNYLHNEAPKTLHMILLSAYAIGSFAGGFITAYIALNKKILRAMTVGGLLMGIGIYNLILANYPSWVIGTAFFIFLPFAYFGGRIAKNVTAKKQHLTH